MKTHIDTITAISTPLGTAGIGIVRLSGPQAIPIAAEIFKSKDGRTVHDFKSHTVHYGWAFDEALLTVMRAPKTYTREDIVEINCHSGAAALKKILDLTVQNGARLAEPGEFTKRAFLNGRIDLTQAEAVLDVINAKTDKALAVAENQLKGKLSVYFNDLRGGLIDILANIEASLDFSQEDIDVLDRGAIIKRLKGINKDLEKVIQESARGIALRDGVKIVITGKPNAGKSSLMNALAGVERVIVTPIAGTTRDSVEHTVDINGIPATLVDTAGIIRARNLIDKFSVEKSLDNIAAAEIILFLLDGSRPLSDEDEHILKVLEGRNFIMVVNKADLNKKGTLTFFDRTQSGGEKGERPLFISATNGTGLSELRGAIAEFFWKGASSEPEDILITNARHKKAMEGALTLLERAAGNLGAQSQEELASVDIREAIGKIDEITGQKIGDDILGRIFSQFCIGK